MYHQIDDDKSALKYLKTAAEFAKKLDNAPDGTERIKRYYNYGTAHRELSATQFLKAVMTEHYPLSEKFKGRSEFLDIIALLE